MTMPALNHLQPQFASAFPPSVTAKTARRSSSHDPRRAVTHHDDQVAPRRTRALAAARYRLGWTGGLNEIADVRRLILSGIDERLAAQVVADHSSAPGHFQCLPERNDHFATSLRRAVPDVQEAIGKDLTRGTEPFVGAAKSHD